MTRFNITALQEQGMTPEEINAYIAERERAMYGGPRNSGAPTTQSESFDTKLNSIISFFEALHQNIKKSNPKGIAACKMSLEMKGGITVQELCAANDIGERTLERFFKTYIGLSPKFYTRILRFSQIFEHVKRENFDVSKCNK